MLHSLRHAVGSRRLRRPTLLVACARGAGDPGRPRHSIQLHDPHERDAASGDDDHRRRERQPHVRGHRRKPDQHPDLRRHHEPQAQHGHQGLDPEAGRLDPRVAVRRRARRARSWSPCRRPSPGTTSSSSTVRAPTRARPPSRSGPLRTTRPAPTTPGGAAVPLSMPTPGTNGSVPFSARRPARVAQALARHDQRQRAQLGARLGAEARPVRARRELELRELGGVPRALHDPGHRQLHGQDRPAPVVLRLGDGDASTTSPPTRPARSPRARRSR